MSDGEEFIAPFLAYLMAEKGLSSNTIAAYRQDLLLFFAWVKKPVREIQEEEMIGFATELKARHYAESSVRRMLVTLKVFSGSCVTIDIFNTIQCNILMAQK